MDEMFSLNESSIFLKANQVYFPRMRNVLVKDNYLLLNICPFCFPKKVWVQTARRSME